MKSNCNDCQMKSDCYTFHCVTQSNGCLGDTLSEWLASSAPKPPPAKKEKVDKFQQSEFAEKLMKKAWRRK